MDEEFKKLLEDKIRKATALRLMVASEGWDILLSTFQDMKDNQLAELSKQIPGDEKGILAAHAVWWSVIHTLDQIVSAVSNAINEGDAARQELDVSNPQEEDWL